MGSFLKKILEPSEQDAFDHLTWTGKPCVDIFEGLRPEDVLPSANVGLPSALVPRQPPGPAYVTHTGRLVRLLLLQERLGRAVPPEPRPRTERRDPAARERSPAWGRGGSTAGTEEDSRGTPEEKSSSTAPDICHRIIFARKPPPAVQPQSSQACSSKRE